ncbi:hypothetical protein BGX34_011399 [Mortierella sp. NVP85]|nr:hypothetical protein BGX34_011399 [Mortierella sp. NVP85]
MGAQALAQVQNNHRRSASLQQRSYSDHPKGYSGNSSSNGTISGRNITSFSQVNLRLKGNDSLGTSPPSVHVFSRHTKAPTNATMTAISPVVALEQLKLNKITRLLQLFIACTPVQARLPALRYPGYGQQWIRAPCRVDYLQYYIDQQQGNEIMIQCFHLLFADLVHCDENPGLGGNVVPIAPPDQEAYKVLHQIQKEFMGHCADRIRTLSVSVAHTIEHAGTLVPRLGAVTRLELTDLEELLDSQNGGDALEKVLDLIKSHRLTFGYVLKDLILTGKSNSFKLLSSTAPTSPVSLAATGLTTPPTSVPSSPTTPFDPLSSSPFSESYYTSRIPTVTNKNGHSNILTIIEAVKGLERLDLSGWTSAILHLDRIASPQLKALWLSFTFPSSDYMDSRVARLPEYLERCRHLEELRVPIRRADVFGWAANEKRSSLICAPILASSRTKRLPNMRRIHLQGPSVELLDCVIDAAFAFQETLQDLEASSRMAVFQPTTIEWDWYLPRLTRLRLEGPISMHFKLDSLQRCPALEELVLSTMPAEECSDEYQQVDPHYLPQPSRLRHRQHHHQDQPTIADPTSYLMMYIRTPEMYRIGSLRRLKTLKLVGPWQVADTVLRRIADRCTRLRELTLNRTLGLTPGGVLLAIENMHQLERLDLRMDVEDLHLVRVVTRKLPRLNYVRVTNLRQS